MEEPPGGFVGARSADGEATFQHVPGLDGLRGLAVAAVLLYHAGHLTGGYLGVDLFFVLSGYLITSLLLLEHQRHGRIDLRAFWARRVRRLLPGLLVFLTGVAAYAHWVARPIDLRGIRSEAFATILYVANWRNIVDGASYWDISKVPSPLQHTWSLAIEEQFYLLWPLAFAGLIWWLARDSSGAAGPRRRREAHARRIQDLDRLVLRVALVGMALSFGLVIGLHAAGVSTMRIYEGTDTRAGAIFAGVALAVWAKRRRERFETIDAEDVDAARHAVEGVGLVALGLLLVLWSWLDGESSLPYQGLLPGASILGAMVVGAVAEARSSVLGRLFSTPPLRALGIISYGLYLWHWPIYLALDSYNGRIWGMGGRVLDDGELLIAKLAASLIVAIVSYELIEQPIRRNRLAKPARAPMAVAGALATVALLVVVTRTDVVGPDTGPVAASGATVQGAPRVLVVGDSVALSIAHHLVADTREFGINVENRAEIGCSEVAADIEGVNSGGRKTPPAVSCRGSYESEVATLDPDVVFFEIGARPNDRVVIDDQPVGACEPAWQERYKERLAGAIDIAASSGAKVGVATVLHSGANARRVDGSEDRIDCANAAIREVVDATDGAFLVDVDGFVCPNGACAETLDGGPVRSDGLHFDRGPGGKAVARWIAEQLVAEVRAN